MGQPDVRTELLDEVVETGVGTREHAGVEHSGTSAAAPIPAETGSVTTARVVSSGANVKAVQRMLGHASAAMTLDVYADLFDDDLDTLADRLETTASEARADYSRTGTGVIHLHQDSIQAAKAADLYERSVGPVGPDPLLRTRFARERAAGAHPRGSRTLPKIDRDPDQKQERSGP